MKTLKENFGRRMALIGGCIIAILISLLIVASFSIQAKADPNEDPHQNPFPQTDQVVLTRIVHAAEGANLSGEFTYTFTKVSYAGIVVTDQTDTHMPTAGTNGTVTLPLTVTNGEVPADTDNFMYAKKTGPGTIATEDTDGTNTDATGLDVTWAESSSNVAYEVQQRLTTIFTNFSTFTWTTGGEYIYTITETDQTDDYANHGSSAAYTLHIYVADNSGTMTVTGFIMDQNAIDDGTAVLVEKKDPRKNYGQSNDSNRTTTPLAGGNAVNWYRGFTYTSKITEADQNFYIEKVVNGQYPDYGHEFRFYPEFYNYDWTVGTVIYGYIHNIDGSGTDVLVQFTVSQVTVEEVTYNAARVTQVGGATPTPANSLPLKHGQRLIFDGTTVSGQLTNKLPVGTTYGYYEDLSDFSSSDVVGAAQTYTADTAAAVASQQSTDPHRLTVAYDGTTDPAITPAVATARISAAPSTAPSQENKSIVTNTMSPTPTGFLIDALPYILMIGIPLAAFIIWMVGRRRKINR